MKKIMGHLKGKLSLSILSVIVLLVGVLAGITGITSVKAGGKQTAATSRASQNGVASVTPAASKAQVSARPASASAPAAAAPVAAKPAASQESASASKNDAAPAKLPTEDEARSAAVRLPLVFEPNQGQTGSQVKFYAHSFGYQVYMTGAASATLKFPENRKHEKKAQELEKKDRNPDVVTMTLAGADNSVVPQLLDATGGTSDYYLGSDPSKWVMNVPNYTKLRYDGIYPGIDVVYQGDNQHFRYDFHVNPGADPKAIRIAYQGGQGVRIDNGGNTVVDLSYGHLVASKPVIFQEYGGQRHSIDGKYVLTADNSLAFEVGAYDKSQTLIIDPSDSYATYFGPIGSGFSTKTNNGGVITPGLPVAINAVAIDSTGVYLTGNSAALSFPATCAGGAGDGLTCGGTAGWAAKLNLNLSATIKSISFGGEVGTSVVWPYGIAVTGGAPVVVGATNAGQAFPVVKNLEASPADVNFHAFVISLSSALAINYSSLLSGTGTEAAYAVAIEQTTGLTGNHPGNIHITGLTTSGTLGGAQLGPSSFLGRLPMATGASQPFQSTQNSSINSTLLATNAFYVDLNASGSTAAYATLFGGWAEDFGTGVAVDGAGFAYVTGDATSFGAGQVIGFENTPGVAATAATENIVTSPGLYVLNTPIGSGCFEGGGPVTFPAPIPPTDFFGTPVTAQGTAVVNNTGTALNPNYQVVAIALTNPGAGYSITQNPMPVSTGCGTVYAYIMNIVVTGNSQNASGNNLPIPTNTLVLTNPGSGYNTFTPPVTFTGGQCVVEPTAVAIVNIDGALDSLVLTSTGTGCVTAPTVSIQAPPVGGSTATAVYTPGTPTIPVNPLAAFVNSTTTVGAVPTFHGFVAKFNPYATAAASGTTNANSLVFATAIGSPGPGYLEEDLPTSITVDLFGNTYVGGLTIADTTTPSYVVTNPIFTGSTATPNLVFTSPGLAAGELTGITVTNAGFGFGSSLTGQEFYFAWGHNPNDGCLIYPAATYSTDASGEVIPNSVAITNSGLGCTIVPQVGIHGNALVNVNGFTASASLGTQLAGPSPTTREDDEPTGWVLEMVAQTSLNNGLTTTSTQDGIPLGNHAPSSQAGWPAMVYATMVAGDENCAPCTPGTVAGGFGNGSGTTPAGSISDVSSVAVDSLGNTYIGGYISSADAESNTGVPGTPAETTVNPAALALRRRVNVAGYPINALAAGLQTLGSATIRADVAAANGSFLSTFPQDPDQFVTPFGSIIIGASVATFEGVFNGVAFDPVTDTACWGGWLDEPIAAASGSSTASDMVAPPSPGTPTQLFPLDLSLPLNFTTEQDAFAYPANTTLTTPNTGPFAQIFASTANQGWYGFAACTVFQDDIVVKVTNPTTGETASTILFTLPTGTQNAIPGGGVNSNPNWPASQTISATCDGTLGACGSVGLGPIQLTYYQGKSAETTSGDGPDSSTASDILWLTATPQGSTILLSLNPSINPASPGASFLDPGIYYCLVQVTPLGTADNSGIPQLIVVQLNVTGTLFVNSTVDGGTPAVGSNAAGNVINLTLQAGSGGSAQAGLGSAQWTTPNQVLDQAGNIVLNIPVVSNTPLASPTNGNFVFLVNQGTLATPKPASSLGSPINANLAVLNTGFDTGDNVLINSTPSVNPLNNNITGAGSVFLTPIDAGIEIPGGTLSPVADIQFLPQGGSGCGPFTPPDQADPTAKAGANDVVCYIQVVIPPTILQGAAAGSGPYTATLELQSIPNLTDPASPVRNNESEPYLDFTPIASTDGDFVPNPGVESFCVGTACSVSNLGVVTGASAVAKITVSISLTAGPIIINSPWISNTITACNDDTSAGAGEFFSDPVCNSNGPRIPLAPFTVPSGFGGVVTSTINNSPGGNNPNNPFDNVVLDSRNLGTSAEAGYTVTAVGGLQPVGVGQNPSPTSTTTVSALQVYNDYFVYQDLSDLYPIYQIPTCTLSSPAIPASVLTVNGSSLPATFSNVLPPSNASQTTTAITIGINNPSALTDGFYASTLTVTPVIGGTAAPNQATQIPVCLLVGNVIEPIWEKILPPTVTPPPFDPSNFIIPADGLVLSSGQTQYIQLIINALGPNQVAPIAGQATFGTPMFVAVPVTITPASTNPTWVFPLTSLPNIGNEFSAPLVSLVTGTYLGSINEGGVSTAVNCSQITGWNATSDSPATGCFTDAYEDFVIAAPGGNSNGTATNIAFTVTAASNLGLLDATDPGASTFNVSLPIVPTVGNTLVYTACSGSVYTGAGAGGPVGCVSPTSAGTPGVVAYLTLIASNGYTGGYGYTTVPNVHFTGGCSVEPTAVATISQPGAIGYVSGLFLTSPGSGCSAAPVVVIDAPATPTGVVAAGQAFISNSLFNFTFNLGPQAQPGTATSCLGTVPVGNATCSGPAYDTIFVQASQFGDAVVTPTSSLPLPLIYYNPPASYLLPVGPPVTGDWLNVASVNCTPTIIPNATPIAECEFTISLNPSASELPTGTYQAYVAFQGTGTAVEPAVVEATVTLNITSQITVISTAPAAGYNFEGFTNGNTTPGPQTFSLSLSGFPTSTSGTNTCAANPAQAICEVIASATVSQNNGPAGWLLLNNGTAAVPVTLQGPGGTAATLTISISAASLTALANSSNLPLTWNGAVTITSPSSQVSDPIITIPVSVTILPTPGLSFSPAGPSTPSFTIGQTDTTLGAAETISTSVVQNGTGTGVTLTSSCGSPAVTPCPWATVSPTTGNSGTLPVTITLTPASIPTTPGTATATITATGKAGGSATYTVSVNVLAPPTITFTTLNCGPASVTAGIASLTCTTNAALSSAPANPTTLPVSITASTTGSASNCVVSSTNPVAIASLGTAATPVSFTITPSSGTGLSAGSCAVALAAVSTGGITPPVTGSVSTTVAVLGAQLQATPPSLIYNLPVGAAPATQQETVVANSGTSASNIAVPFACNPSVALPVGGSWLACTGGTTSSVSAPPPNSTVTVTAAALAAGQYGGAIAYSTSQLGVSNPPSNNPVTLFVGALSVTGGPITFNNQLGVTGVLASEPIVPQTLQIGAGLAAIGWTSSTAGDCAWLNQSPTSGTTAGANNTSPITLTYTVAAANSEGVGAHVCTITFAPAASYGAPASDAVSVTATLNVSSNPVFNVTPGTQSITVLVTPGAATTTTSFNVSVSSIQAPATSVTATVTPVENPLNTGTTPTPIFTAPSPISVTTTPTALTITANYGGLPVGTYQGSFLISSPSVTTPATVVVNLVVAQSCSFTVAPAGPISLTNVVPSNGTTPVSVPGAFTVTPSGLCSGSNTYQVTSDSSWLIVTQGSTGTGNTVGSGQYLALSNSTPNARTAHLIFTPSAGNISEITFTQPASTAAVNLLEVTALYQQILGRDPDAGGYAFWTTTGAAGLGQMADAFFTSPESYNTNFSVIAAYQAATGAPPTFAEFTAAVLNIRYNAGTVSQLFNSLISASYSTTNLYANLLNRAPAAGDAACVASGALNCFLTLIASPATATPVGPGSNNEFQSTGTFANHTASCTSGTPPCVVPGDHTNGLYIYMLYFTTLSRDPDPSGLDYWLGEANSGGAGILFQGSTEQGVRLIILGTGAPNEGFIGSPEFQSHF